jgi:hypothetical protein
MFEIGQKTNHHVMEERRHLYICKSNEEDATIERKARPFAQGYNIGSLMAQFGDGFVPPLGL